MAEEAYATCTQDYKIHALDNELLSSFVEYAPSITPDHYIAMIALFFHTKRKNGAVINRK
jgi:hypothetical protein